MVKCRKTAAVSFGPNAIKNKSVNWSAQGAAMAPATNPNNRPDARPLLSNLNLRNINDAFRQYTGSPIGAGLALGTAAAGAGWLAAPHVARLLQPGMSNEMLEYQAPGYRKRMAWLSGGLFALAPLVYNFSTKHPGFGLTSYTPKDLSDEAAAAAGLKKTNAQRKKSSAMLFPAVTMEDAYRDVALSDVRPDVKTKMFDMLDATNLPADAPVTQHKLIDAAVDAGMSALEAGSVGYLAASVMGLPDPKRAALTMGGIGGLASLIF